MVELSTPCWHNFMIETIRIKRLLKAWHQTVPDSPLLRQAADFVLRPSKHLRGQLAMLMAGQSQHSEPLALSIELLHSFALVHDDIMDQALTRRGMPALHHQLSDQSHIGLSRAILAGDWLLMQAEVTFAQLAQDSPNQQQLLSLWHTMLRELVLGQDKDILASTARPSERDLLAIIHAKTSLYSITRPLQLGLLLSDRLDGEAQQWTESFGRSAGLAFQLQDDYLDIFGDPLITGKPNGTDYLSGTYTIIQSRLDQQGTIYHDFDSYRQALITSGVLDLLLAEIAEHYATARLALTHAQGLSGESALLESVLSQLEKRTH